MVCVGAPDGANEVFPTGTKQWSATARACAPEIRITANPPSPRGVAMAAMVSSNIGLKLQVEGCGLQVGRARPSVRAVSDQPFSPAARRAEQHKRRTLR